MRIVNKRGGPATLDGLARRLDEICEATQEQTEQIADGYAITLPVGFVPVRTLDLTATLTANQVATVFASFIIDMQNRGINRRKNNG